MNLLLNIPSHQKSEHELEEELVQVVAQQQILTARRAGFCGI